jgi:tRNA(fMet)-specific endonuclease VapC
MIVFDTDVISYVLRAEPPLGLVRRIAQLDPEIQATTSITVGELVFGAHRSSCAEHFLAALRRSVWPNLRTLAFDHRSAEIFGELRAELERSGTPLAEPDLRIGSICLANDAVLATGNVRHFKKIPGLKVEDWLAEHR